MAANQSFARGSLMRCMRSACERGNTANALPSSADCSTGGVRRGMQSCYVAQGLYRTITIFAAPATDVQLPRHERMIQ